MIERQPAEVFSPLDFVREEADARCWTWDGLAKWCHVASDELEARLAIGDVDEPLAERIGRAFGTSAQLWLNISRSYRAGRDA